MRLWNNNLFFHFITPFHSWTSSYILCNKPAWCLNSPVFSSAFCHAGLSLCALICPFRSEVQIFLPPAAASWLGRLQWALWSGVCTIPRLVKLSKHNNVTVLLPLTVYYTSFTELTMLINWSSFLRAILKAYKLCSHLRLHLLQMDGEAGQARSASSVGLYSTDPSENSVEH